jgi:hypothetical protein
MPSSPPFSAAAKNNTERPVCVLEGMAESIGPMWSNPDQTLGRNRAASRRVAPCPGAQVEERVGRTTFRSSSAMGSDRLFLGRVARHHCPPPLHRNAQNITPLDPPSENRTFLLCVDMSP